MGMSSDEGESSARTTDQSDDTEDDRPLKKARYIWQIKGKYHLKEKDQKLVVSSESSSTEYVFPLEIKEYAQCCCVTQKGICQCGKVSALSSPNASIVLGSDQEKKKDDYRPVLEVLDAKSTGSVEKKEEKELSVFQERISPKLSYDIPVPTPGQVVTQCFQTFISTVNQSSCYLKKWQTKQLAKGIVDNTVNKVLEDMGFIPLPGDADDVLEGRNNSEQNFENEAVLMAIQSHGLQRNGNEVTNTGDTGSVKEAVVNKDNDSDETEARNSRPETHLQCQHRIRAPCVCSLPQKISNIDVLQHLDPFHHRPVLFGGEGGQQRGFVPARVYRSFCGLTSAGGRRRKVSRRVRKRIVLHRHRSSESSGDESSQSDGGIGKKKVLDSVLPDKNKNESEERNGTESNAENEDTLLTLEHNEFLDKAVAVAIQKKGLSVLGCSDHG